LPGCRFDCQAISHSCPADTNGRLRGVSASGLFRHAAVASAAASNGSRCRRTTHAMQAILLTSATMTAFSCARPSKPHAQLPSGTPPAASEGSGAGAVHQQFAPVLAAALADAEQPRLAARGCLRRNQPEPGGQIVALGERRAVPNCRR
jgi:hypothetical protein